MLTRLGQIKKTSLSEFANATTGRRSLTILKLHQNDSLQWARITGNDEDVIVGTRYMGLKLTFKREVTT